MAIENRQLEAGTKLVARYKGTDYVATVTADGKYTMDGKEYGSPSAAGSAVMDGKACNGWRFWSIEGTQPAPRERKAKEPKAPKEPKAAKGKTKSTTVVQIKKSRKQETCPEGEVHWFCSACMKGFCQPTGVTPDVCPEGHPRVVDDDMSLPGDVESKPLFKTEEVETNDAPDAETEAAPEEEVAVE